MIPASRENKSPAVVLRHLFGRPVLCGRGSVVPSLQLQAYTARQALGWMQTLHNSNSLMYVGLPWLLVPDQGVDLSDVCTCYAEGCSGELYCSVCVGKTSAKAGKHCAAECFAAKL